MVFVYIKIYYAARERARRVINKPGFGKRISRRFTKQNSPSGETPSGGRSAAVVAANKKASDMDNSANAVPTNQGPISTISNTNGRVNSNHNSTANTLAASGGSATSGTDPGGPSGPTSVLKKRARFDVEPDEAEALLPHECGKSNGVAPKKTVQILSATSVETPSGRVSDPCEVTILNRPHAYGACAQAQNGGQPRTRRSVGVSTKDDLAVISKDNSAKDRKNHADAATSSGLKFRLRCKFKTGGRRPSKETREVIDMGKLSSNESCS